MLDPKFNLEISNETQSEQCHTFVRLMLDEVGAFINPRTQGPWSKSIPSQVNFFQQLYYIGEVVTGYITWDHVYSLH